MERKKGTMSMALFKRIIDDAATVEAINHVTITGLGEPFLDRFLPDRIAYVKSKMPRVLLDLYTNGSLLRPELVDRVYDAGLVVLYISLNAASREKRLAIMKLDDFDRVMEGIKYAMSKPNWKVLVKGLMSKDLIEPGEREWFLDTFKGPYNEGGNAFLHLEGNWAGAMYNVRLKPNEACSRAFGQIMVLQDGRVSLCCFDAEGAETLGDLNYMTIRDIYNGGRALQIREAHNEGRRQTIPLCANCTGI
jgi:hypothetical protein